MTEEAARYQALAASGGAIIAFIGICHETVGPTLFPWGPHFFGGPIPWNVVGILCFLYGLASLAGSLRVIRFPVTLTAMIGVPGGIGFTIFTAIAHNQFHVFALAIGFSSALTAYCFPKVASS